MQVIITARIVFDQFAIYSETGKKRIRNVGEAEETKGEGTDQPVRIYTKIETCWKEVDAMGGGARRSNGGIKKRRDVEATFKRTKGKGGT